MHLLLTLIEKGIPLPAAGILISPWIDLTDTGDGSKTCSWEKNAKYDFIPISLTVLFGDYYIGKHLKPPKSHPTTPTTVSSASISSSTTASSSSSKFSWRKSLSLSMGWFRSSTMSSSAVENASSSLEPEDIPIGVENENYNKVNTHDYDEVEENNNTNELNDITLLQLEEDFCIRVEVESILYHRIGQMDSGEREHDEDEDACLHVDEQKHLADEQSAGFQALGNNDEVLFDKRTVSPTHAPEELLRQLPPLFITAGECEVFHDQIVLFITKLRKLEGVNVWSYIAKDMIHVYP